MNELTLLSAQYDYQYLVNIGFFFMLIALMLMVIFLFKREEKRSIKESIQAKIKANEQKIATNDATLKRLIEDENVAQ